MTDLANQRRLAAEVMDIGVNRVWMDPDASKDIEAALTREDVRKLIEEKRSVKGISEGSAAEEPERWMRPGLTDTEKGMAPEAAQKVLEDQRKNSG